MNKPFTYSILQYRHSFILNEALNVGLIFFFYDEQKVRFVYDKSQRPKNLYPNYDSVIITEILKYIDAKVKKLRVGLFDNISTFEGVKSFINTHIIPDDATSLQFSEPFNALTITNNLSQTINDYSQLLLPSLDEKRIDLKKKNEAYILKKFTDTLFSNDKGIRHGISKDVPLSANKVELTFEIKWENKLSHYVKPISFDLLGKTDIQDKKVKYFGYFLLLKEHAKRNDIEFDLLLTAPADEKLADEYERAKDTLISSKAPIYIHEENQISTYAIKAAKAIRKHIDEQLQ